MSLALLDDPEQAKSLFIANLQHKKQLRALEIFSQTVYFPDQEYLLLLQRCYAKDFLAPKEVEFLGYLLQKHEVNYLEWSFKSPWLKGTIRLMQAARNPEPIKQQSIDPGAFSEYAKSIIRGIPPSLYQATSQYAAQFRP